MSESATAPFRSALPADPMDLLLDRVADHIAPHFVSCPDDFAIAKQAAVRAICAYQPQSQADLVNAARAIAFSMSALAALAQAAAPGTDAALQLRYYGKANTLNRSAAMNERAIERRRHSRQAAEAPPAPTAAPVADAAASPPAVPPVATPVGAPPQPETDAAIEARIAAVIQDYVASRPTAEGAPAVHPEPRPTDPLPPTPAAPPHWQAALLRESAARLAGPGLGQPGPSGRSHPGSVLRSLPPRT